MRAIILITLTLEHQGFRGHRLSSTPTWPAEFCLRYARDVRAYQQHIPKDVHLCQR